MLEVRGLVPTDERICVPPLPKSSEEGRSGCSSAIKIPAAQPRLKLYLYLYLYFENHDGYSNSRRMMVVQPS